MLPIFKCGFVSGLLLRMVSSAPPHEYVVYPRLLDERGLDVEKVLYIQDDVIIRLKKNSVLAERFIFSETVNGTRVDTIMDGKKLEANMYHDRVRMASVNVEVKNGIVKVRGILSNTLRIRPLHIEARSEEGRIPHKIYQVDHRADDSNTFKADLNKNSSQSVFAAELRIVVDSNHRSHFRNKEEIIEYLATCMQMVNIRYEDTKEPMVQFLLTKVEVDDASVPYIFYGKDVDCPTCPSKFYAKADPTLEGTKHIYGHSKEQDITVLVTSLDLADEIYGQISNKVMGMAVLGGLCSKKGRVAVVEDVPHTYSMTQLIAHELAHTLGATHDGGYTNLGPDGNPLNNCSKHDGYIMAPYTLGGNRGHFSNCSIRQIREFVNNLDEDCKKVNSKNKPYDAHTKVLPGTNMSSIDYCKLKHPNFCNITAKEDQMNKCIIECCPGGRVRCSYYRKLPENLCKIGWDMNKDQGCPFKCCYREKFKCFTETAIDGMSCGNEMMCFRGKCIPRCDPFKKKETSSAPATEEISMKAP
ncbi:venom metalloproteinase antarease-like TtrivMP_A [Ixodes scapularis]|uniref:venom metalloproteinase antarease-like TtrivMP_A n=1 Tax=Ixodes scapularis TaxID=6945 RepID=UPI001A9E7AF9|nr:venom metalloproteinase antarease-like TtrivMP_A [Ixodes scapularis]